ncbi:MAG: tRNA pseudouridine(55) synthase TruB [Cyanobacteria bacterium J06597_16]
MINGFISLNKPATWTSHDCVARVRRLLNTKKVGHGGTLDPLATGVLPLAVGRATRLIQYLPARKSYRAVIRFGVTTTTDDLEGDIVTQDAATDLSVSAIEAALPQFLGTLQQIPPMYSAIQIDGKRLYDLARKGKTVDVPVREVTVHQLRVQHWQSGEQPELTLDIDCGPGTYIRSLARDLGEAVGTGATLAQLTRTHSSGFDLESSITLEALEEAIQEETFVPLAVDGAIAHLEAITLSPPLARRWRMGQKLAIPALDTSAPSTSAPSTLEKSTSDTGLSGSGLQFARTRPHSRLNTIGPPIRVLEAKTSTFLGIGEIRWVPPVTAVNSNLTHDTNSPRNNPSPKNNPQKRPQKMSAQKDNSAIELSTELSTLSPILAAKRVYLAID